MAWQIKRLKQAGGRNVSMLLKLFCVYIRDMRVNKCPDCLLWLLRLELCCATNIPIFDSPTAFFVFVKISRNGHKLSSGKGGEMH